MGTEVVVIREGGLYFRLACRDLSGGEPSRHRFGFWCRRPADGSVIGFSILFHLMVHPSIKSSSGVSSDIIMEIMPRSIMHGCFQCQSLQRMRCRRDMFVDIP